MYRWNRTLCFPAGACLSGKQHPRSSRSLPGAALVPSVLLIASHNCNYCSHGKGVSWKWVNGVVGDLRRAEEGARAVAALWDEQYCQCSLLKLHKQWGNLSTHVLEGNRDLWEALAVSRAMAALPQHWGMPSTSHSASDPKANCCSTAALHFGRAEPKWSRDTSPSPLDLARKQRQWLMSNTRLKQL